MWRLMLGCILIDTCEIEGDVDYSSWVRSFQLVGDGPS